MSLAVAPPAVAATYHHLVNFKSGKCLPVSGGGSTANAAKKIASGCATT